MNILFYIATAVLAGSKADASTQAKQELLDKASELISKINEIQKLETDDKRLEIFHMLSKQIWKIEPSTYLENLQRSISEFETWLSKRSSKLNKNLRYPMKKLAKLEAPVNEIYGLVFNFAEPVEDEDENIDEDERDMLDIEEEDEEEEAESISAKDNEIDEQSELEKSDL